MIGSRCLRCREGDVHKIIIPSPLKWEIRDKLDQTNINERILMTGLDCLCAWVLSGTTRQSAKNGPIINPALTISIIPR